MKFIAELRSRKKRTIFGKEECDLGFTQYRQQMNYTWFTPAPIFPRSAFRKNVSGSQGLNSSLSRSAKIGAGFTLIEILVVVAIIALLTSVLLISLQSAREKSRNVKRLSDMTQMNTVLDLFYVYNKGYPDTVNGVPQGMTPTFLASMPEAPVPPDGFCGVLTNPLGVMANLFYYAPTGTPYTLNGVTYYPDYNYYFCLGAKTGDFEPGLRTLTPKGVR